MKNMEEWFAEQDFNTEELPSGHRNRFLERLETACEEQQDEIEKLESKGKGRVISLGGWTRWSLVAGMALLLGFAGFNYTQAITASEGLESVSPEMAQAQDFFTSTINYELERLDQEQSPDTERIIADTKSGLNQLETEYQRPSRPTT